MAVDYVVQETRFDPGKFHIRVVPPQVIGPVTVIVRTDYGGPNLREGSLANIQQAP